MQIQRLLTAAGAAIGVVFLSSVPTQQTVAAEQDTSGVIEEIVVTSRRREESVQDVPLSVTVFGEQQIERLKPTTMRDFDGAQHVYDEQRSRAKRCGNFHPRNWCCYA